MSKLDFILADNTHYAMIKALDEVIQASQADKFATFIVLVPDGKTIMAERYLLQKCQSGAFSNIYIYTLKRLLNKIAPINNKLVLNKSAGTMIVRKIVLENLDKLVCFKKTANTNGFAETIYGTISQLKSSGVSVSDFYDMLDGVKASTKIKMQDIAFLYDEYQQFIENKYIDQSDLYSVLNGAVQTSDFIKNSNIYFVGFESITSEAISVVKEIMDVCKKFVVSCPYMANVSNGHIADNEIFNKFKHIADQKNYIYIPKKFNQPLKADFNHIQENLYAYPAKVKKGTNCIEIGSALDKDEEIDWVAQKIIGLIKSGARYKNIALVVNGLENYQERIEEIFSQYQFSYFISKPYDYCNHPLFKLIKSYLEICRKNYDKASCISFLSNILVEKTEFLDDFINYVNQYGINYLKFTKPFTTFDEKVLTREQFENLENLRKFLIDSTFGFGAKKSTAGEYISQVEKMLENLQISQKLENLQILQNQDKVSQAITMQAYKKFQDISDQIKTFLGSEEMSLDMFQNILLSGLTVTDVSIIPTSIDSITIAGNADGLLDIDYLFILNATEGNFPIKQQDCGIILDAEIMQLNGKSNKTIEPTIKTINRRERYKAYEMFFRANKKVILSFNNGSGENLLKQSNIIDQLINLFGGAEYLKIQKYNNEFEISPNNYEKDITAQLCTKNKAIKYVCTQIGNKRTFGNFDDIRLVNASYVASKKYMPQNLQYALGNINQVENYQIDVSKNLYFSNGKTSTSQLEQYFECPFLFFTKYGLRLHENLTSKLKALDVGNILHKVAEIFMRKLARNSNIDAKSTAQSIVRDIIHNEYIEEDNKFLLKIVAEESIRLCDKLKDEFLHSFYKPQMLEQSFGKDKSVGGVSLTNGIVLEGKIDRVDKLENRFRIIDYKTGKIEDNVKRVFYGKKIQLVTYLLAMKNTGLLPGAVVYFPIRNEFSQENKKIGKMKGFFINDSEQILKMDTTINEQKLASDVIDVKFNKPKNGEFNLRNSANLFSDNQFQDMQNYVQKLCNKAVEEILDGYIMPSPIRLSESEKLHCANCEFFGVCGVDRTNFAMGRKCYSDIKIDTLTKLQGDENGKK